MMYGVWCMMAVDGMHGCRSGNREEGKEPVSKQQIDDSACVGGRMCGLTRDGRALTRLARANCQARTGTEKTNVELFN